MHDTQSTPPLDYAPPKKRGALMLIARRAVLSLVAIVGLILAAIFVPIGRSETYVDPVTRTMTSNRSWLAGLWTQQSVNVTPLERALIDRGIVWKSSQTLVRVTDESLLGLSPRSAPPPPPIFRFSNTSQEWWLATASDDQLRQFVDVMQHGSQADQEAAVEAAMNEVLGSPP